MAHRPGTPKRWPIRYRSEALDLAFELEMTQFKHVGLFPEQADNWEFIAANLGECDRFLNLFAYTGGASLAARQVGADVIHCDAIRQVVDWTRKNMERSGLDGIRWVVEDALKLPDAKPNAATPIKVSSWIRPPGVSDPKARNGSSKTNFSTSLTSWPALSHPVAL